VRLRLPQRGCHIASDGGYSRSCGSGVQAEADERDGPGNQSGGGGDETFDAVVGDGEVFEPLAWRTSSRRFGVVVVTFA